ncbi:MAG: hypothetical protein IPM39_24895 [Chloroflexi bacterium]|nr:hypothetical protein [Chloroflexota bacterium]
MESIINETLAEICRILTELLVPTHANAVYDYRTMPAKLPFVISASFAGGRPEVDTSAGIRPVLTFFLVMETQHEKTVDSLRLAEQRLNRAEGIIYQAFNHTYQVHDGHWIFAEIHRDSARPPSPPNYPTSRLGTIYLRIIV